MILAVDTSALMAIFKEEAEASAWMNLLIKLVAANTLVVSDVVWAEVSALFLNHQELRARMDDLCIRLDPISEEAAFLAGQIFAAYRSAGGPREHLIPDFMIAAHAQVQAHGLIAADRGYIRRYFKRLQLHTV